MVLANFVPGPLPEWVSGVESGILARCQPAETSEWNKLCIQNNIFKRLLAGGRLEVSSTLRVPPMECQLVVVRTRTRFSTDPSRTTLKQIHVIDVTLAIECIPMRLLSSCLRASVCGWCQLCQTIAMGHEVRPANVSLHDRAEEHVSDASVRPLLRFSTLFMCRLQECVLREDKPGCRHFAPPVVWYALVLLDQRIRSQYGRQKTQAFEGHHFR